MKRSPVSLQAQGPASEGPHVQWVGLVPGEKKALLRTHGPYRLGGALLYKEMLCSDISEQPQLAHWGGGQWRELVCGSLQRLVPPASRTAASADRGAIVPCPLCAVQGVWGYRQGWE